MKKVKPKVQLIGEDGNSLMIAGRCKRALQNAGYSKEELDKFQKEVLSGDYDNVLQTAMKWCDVY